MLPTIIQNQLASLRRRERMLGLAWGVARLLGVIVGLVLLFCLIDYAIDRFRDTPFVVHLAFLLLLFAGVIGAGVWFFLPIIRRLEDDELSLWVEDKTPRLQHRLISAVQFNKEGAEIEGMSVELVSLVTDEAVEHTRRVSFPRVADHGRVKRSALVFGPTLAAIALPLIVLGPALCGILLARLFLADVAIPRRVTLYNQTAQHHPMGKKMTIKVRALGVLDGDRAYVRLTRNDARTTQDLHLTGAVVPFHIDLFAARVAGVANQIEKSRQEIDENSREMPLVDKRIEEVDRQLAKSIAELTELNKLPAEGTPSLPKEALADRIKRTKKEVADVTKDLEARRIHKTDMEDRTRSAIARLRVMTSERAALKNDIEAHVRELQQVIDELERRHKDGESASGAGSELAEAVERLSKSVKDIDPDNAEASLKQALDHLVRADHVLFLKPLTLIEGDVLTFKLPQPLPLAGVFSWHPTKIEGALVKDGDGGVSVDPSSLVNHRFLQFKAAKEGTGTLEIELRKGSAVEQILKLTVAVAPRKVFWYQTAVDSPATGTAVSFLAYVGDARMKEDATAEFLPLPVADVQAVMFLPAYCQTNPSGAPYFFIQPKGDVSGLASSGVFVTAKANMPIKSARLHLYGRDYDWLGARVTRPSASLNARLGLEGKGVLLTEIGPESPAARFGIKDYDVLLQLGDRSIGNDPEQLWFYLKELDHSQSLKAVVLRDGRRLAVTVENENVKEPEVLSQILSRHSSRLLASLDMNLSKSGTEADGGFLLRSNHTGYRIEVVDEHGFGNDPLTVRRLGTLEEKKPTADLLPDELASLRKRLKELKIDYRDEEAVFEGLPVVKNLPIMVRYNFKHNYGVGKAVLKYRIHKRRLEGSNSSDVLGVALDDIPEGGAKVRDLLENGLASKAAVKKDDVIVQLDAVKIPSVAKLIDAANDLASAKRPGDKIFIKVKRGDNFLTFEGVLGKPPDESWHTFNLVPPYKPGKDEKNFQVHRGQFENSPDKKNIYFYGIPADKPALAPSNLAGGGRFFFQTRNIVGGPIDIGDKLEYYIQVYPALNSRPMERIENLQEEMDVLHKKIDEANRLEDPLRRSDALKNLAPEQERLQEEVQNLAPELAEFNADMARGDLGHAAAKMRKAAGQMSRGEDPAANHQEIKKHLNQAKAHLEQAYEELARRRPIGKTESLTRTVATVEKAEEMVEEARRQVAKLLSKQKSVFSELQVGPDLPPAMAGAPYRAVLSVSGGSNSYTSVALSKFDPGTTGLIAPFAVADQEKSTITVSGTPLRPGVASFTVTVTDSSRHSADQVIKLTVVEQK